jgi:hypothetical protein
MDFSELAGCSGGHEQKSQIGNTNEKIRRVQGHFLMLPLKASERDESKLFTTPPTPSLLRRNKKCPVGTSLPACDLL